MTSEKDKKCQEKNGREGESWGKEVSPGKFNSNSNNTHNHHTPYQSIAISAAVNDETAYKQGRSKHQSNKPKA
eukprot:m.227055 g.227055  ORF g.227055 m.227055 type:complete len:73 (+) comp26408_c0_seq3:1486-1704(+)